MFNPAHARKITMERNPDGQTWRVEMESGTGVLVTIPHALIEGDRIVFTATSGPRTDPFAPTVQSAG